MFNFEVYAYLFEIKEGENFNHRRPEGSALGVNTCSISQKVYKFESDFHKGSQSLSVEIVNFLGDWLVGHIKGSDKKYAPFLIERGIE